MPKTPDRQRSASPDDRDRDRDRDLDRDRDRDRSRDRSRERRRRARDPSRDPAEKRGGGPAAADNQPEGMEGRLLAAIGKVSTKIEDLDKSLRTHVKDEIKKSEAKTDQRID